MGKQTDIQSLTQFNADIKRIRLYDDTSDARRKLVPGEFDFCQVADVIIPAIGDDPVVQNKAILLSTDGQRYFAAPRGVRFRFPETVRNLHVMLSEDYTDECDLDLLVGRGDVADFRWVYNGETLNVKLTEWVYSNPLYAQDMAGGLIRPRPNPLDGPIDVFSANYAGPFPYDIMPIADNVYGATLKKAVARVRTVGTNATRFGFYFLDAGGNKHWVADWMVTVPLVPGDTLELPFQYNCAASLGLQFGIEGGGAAGYAFDISVLFAYKNSVGI